MAKTLTDVSVRNVKPQEKRFEIPDNLAPGLHLVVQPSGAKSWCVRYRVFTVPRKFTIGDVATFDIKAARKKAREVRQAAAEGIDHSALKRASKVAARDGKGESGTFTFVARNFINRYARAKKLQMGRGRAATWATSEQI